MPAVLPLRLRFRAGAAAQPDRHHRFLFASVVVLVSVNGWVQPLPSDEELHRQCFASVSQCAGAQTLVSARLRIVLEQSSPACTCDTPPLRPHATLLHNAPIQNMQGSHSAKAPFGALHIPNKALCKVAYAGNCRVPAP